MSRRDSKVHKKHAFFKTVKSHLEQEPTGLKYMGYQLLNDGLLTYKGRLYILNCDDLKRFMMYELHKIPDTGHPGYRKMITTTRKLFYWLRVKKEIVDYLDKCIEFHQVKEEH
jgi:hypothetical protein